MFKKKEEESDKDSYILVRNCADSWKGKSPKALRVALCIF